MEFELFLEGNGFEYLTPISMIIFFESGRLGNQLFQYCAMKKLQPKGAILAVGMADLNACFTNIKFTDSSLVERLLLSLVIRLGPEVLEYAARHLRLISLVTEVATKNGAGFCISEGLIRSLVYFKAGYYQAENIVDHSIADSMLIRPEILLKSKEILDQLPCCPKDRYFVHVRRGDYLRWPTTDAPAVLPLTWYKEQMERLRKLHSSAYFIVLSDDQSYIDEHFGKDERVFLSHENFLTDFALMCGCQGGGVLSASSFSWWGGYYVYRKNSTARIIAPKHWIGHRTGSWFPLKIKTSWIEYQLVRASDSCDSN